MAGTTPRPGSMTSSTGYGTSPQSPNGYPSAPPQNAMAGMPLSMPPAYGGLPTGMPTGTPQSPSISAYPSMGNAAGVPFTPAGYNAGFVNPMQAQSSMPNALPGGYQPSSLPPSGGSAAVAPTYAGAAPYRPGSVGRQTSYDFSNQATGGAGMPPANVPNTANGLPSGQPNTMYR